MVALFGVWVTLFFGTPGVAQTTDDPNAPYIHGDNTRHWGPFYVTPYIHANAGWDSNVYYAEEDTLTDSALVMTASTEVLWPVVRHFRIIGTGGLTPNYFTNVASARSLDRSGSLRAEFDVGPLTVSGTAGAGRAKQRFSTEIDERLWRDEDSEGAGATLHLGRRLSASGSWFQDTYSYEQGVLVDGSDVAQSLDRREDTTQFGMQYSLTRRTNLTAMAQIIDDTFLGTTGDPIDQPVRSYRYLGGLSFTPASKIAGQVLAGWRDYPGGQDAPAYSGPTLQVSLLLPFVGDGLNLIAERDISYAVGQAQTSSGSQRNSYISSAYSAGFGFDLPLSLVVHLGGGFQSAQYLLPYIQADTPLNRVDDVWTASGALLRRFGSRVQVGGSVVRSWRSSNAVGKNYNDTLYGVTADIRP